MHQYALASPHRLATDAGAAVFREGGNAIDAALAAASSLTVVYPHMCSIGGDIMALVAQAEGGIWAVNGSGAAALDCRPEEIRSEFSQMPLLGAAPITVPGAVSAWESLATLGSRPLSSVIRAAIEFADEGVPVAPSLARSLSEMPDLLSDPGMRRTFSRDGVPLGEDDILGQPALAESLRIIARDGASAFYGGEVGERLIAGLRSVGSPLRREDLERHVSEFTAPLTGCYGDIEILTAPPNSQGFVLLEILSALEHLEEVPDPLGDHAPLLAELCRLASIDRDRYLADPRFKEVPLEKVLSETYGTDLLERARGRLEVGGGAASRSPVPKGDTVAVVAADSEGNAASVIQSVFHTFGSGILEPETGIILHNRGASFDLDSNSPNVLEPGKRPLHTLMPVMVRRGDELIGVQGTMGGKAQPQIHLQLLLRMLRSETPSVALAAPRWTVGGLEEGQASDVLRVERTAGVPALERLARSGMEIVVLADRDEEVGHGQLIRRGVDGRLEVGTDPRADGSAVISSIRE